jgi:glycosyltransferase involved in cell wall biosynthesis
MMSLAPPTTDDCAAPLLSIGLPVFNGESFVEDAIQSILDQSCTAFELIISDNGSTDRTEEICRGFAEADPRVRYFRNDANLGAAANWNRVFELAHGTYFKWIAHDDLHEPEFLARCLHGLQGDPSAVLAFTRAVTVDRNGKFIREWAADPRLGAIDPADRYRASMAPPKDPLPLPIFGVIRAKSLRATRLFRWYPDADIALLAELSLHGRFLEVPEPLFVQREHDKRAGPRLARDPNQAIAFWNPVNIGRIRFPHWSLTAGHLVGLLKAPLRIGERARCSLIFAGWLWRNLGRLSWDFPAAASRIPAIGPWVVKLAVAIRARSWRFRLARAAKDLERLVPPSNMYVLVDAGEFGDGLIANRTARPFIEREHRYWGPPPDDDTAVRELERMRNQGALFVVFGWPCFWWLTYYRGFVAYLDENFERILENDRLIAYDLREQVRKPAAD